MKWMDLQLTARMVLIKTFVTTCFFVTQRKLLLTLMTIFQMFGDNEFNCQQILYRKDLRMSSSLLQFALLRVWSNTSFSQSLRNIKVFPMMEVDWDRFSGCVFICLYSDSCNYYFKTSIQKIKST